MKNLWNNSLIGLGIAFALLGLSTTATAQSNYGAQNAFVTVYEDCNFNGTARNVPIGEYRSLKTIRFANDRMSSIKVPPGLTVVIYEDDNYGGAYATIDRDITCFDRQWDNTVSSLRVLADNNNNRGDRNDRRRDNQQRNNQPRNDTVTTSNEPSRRIQSECFTFKAYTNGGNGSLRFHGKGDLYRFDRKAASSRICHNGSLTMEIGKTERATNVIVELDGKRYRFASNEQQDELKNSWYRKYVRLSVGR
ncbi:hypothetical protein [Arenicella xantha]|uniref:Beta/gamma crystallin n=1 Tax=Arenicella xantha TaxID=644221 RepID=A0A395JGV7_9GAMM|nr:hypothetical protein [Arenicella xantha]RBP48675.1 beta/gamma crystallin [Arenicella xantha]